MMPRGEVAERQPLLFPLGEFGPPDGPGGPTVACAGGFHDDDWEFQFAMAWPRVAAGEGVRGVA